MQDDVERQKRLYKKGQTYAETLPEHYAYPDLEMNKPIEGGRIIVAKCGDRTILIELLELTIPDARVYLQRRDYAEVNARQNAVV